MTAQRHAPAFEIQLSPDPGLGVAAAVLGAASGVALVAAVAMQWGFGLGPWLASSALLGCAMAGLGWRLTRCAPQTLRWDGQAWWLDEAAQGVAVAMDLGGWLLLRLTPTGGGWLWPRYLALSRAHCGAQWSGLRATLYSAHVQAPPS
jgi:hypothetical protein